MVLITEQLLLLFSLKAESIFSRSNNTFETILMKLISLLSKAIEVYLSNIRVVILSPTPFRVRKHARAYIHVLVHTPSRSLTLVSYAIWKLPIISLVILIEFPSVSSSACYFSLLLCSLSLCPSLNTIDNPSIWILYAHHSFWGIHSKYHSLLPFTLALDFVFIFVFLVFWSIYIHTFRWWGGCEVALCIQISSILSIAFLVTIVCVVNYVCVCVRPTLSSACVTLSLFHLPLTMHLSQVAFVRFYSKIACLVFR